MSAYSRYRSWVKVTKTWGGEKTTFFCRGGGANHNETGHSPRQKKESIATERNHGVVRGPQAAQAEAVQGPSRPSVDERPLHVWHGDTRAKAKKK